MKMKHLGLTLALATAAAAPAGAAVDIYDFETSRITSGPLGTQDNWHIDDAGFGGFGEVTAGSNGTRTLTNRAIISRVNHADWSFDIDFLSTSWGFAFDFLAAGGTRYAYLGGDSGTPDNILDSSEFFGYTGGGFHVHRTGTSYAESDPISFNGAHWYRSAWVFNWVDMTLSSFYQDLTDAGDFIPVPGLQNVDIDFSVWNNLKTFTEANLGFGIYQYPSSEVDNYQFGFVVPEPASAALLTVGVVVMLKRRKA